MEKLLTPLHPTLPTEVRILEYCEGGFLSVLFLTPFTAQCRVLCLKNADVPSESPTLRIPRASHQGFTDLSRKEPRMAGCLEQRLQHWCTLQRTGAVSPCSVASSQNAAYGFPEHPAPWSCQTGVKSALQNGVWDGKGVV